MASKATSESSFEILDMSESSKSAHSGDNKQQQSPFQSPDASGSFLNDAPANRAIESMAEKSEQSFGEKPRSEGSGIVVVEFSNKDPEEIVTESMPAPVPQETELSLANGLYSAPPVVTNDMIASGVILQQTCPKEILVTSSGEPTPLPSFSSLSLDGLELQLREIRQENESLKEVIETNNTTMRRLLENIRRTQDEGKAREANLNSQLEEARRQIATLAAEKQELEIVDQTVSRTTADVALIEKLNDEVTALRKELAMSREDNPGPGTLPSAPVSSESDSLHYPQLNPPPAAEYSTAVLNQQLADAETHIHNLNETICTIKQKLAHAESQAEMVPALKTQVDLVTSDYQETCQIVRNSEVHIKELEEQIEALKAAKLELEERLDRGFPTRELAEDDEASEEGHRHGRRHKRHHRKPHHAVSTTRMLLKSIKEFGNA